MNCSIWLLAGSLEKQAGFVFSYRYLQYCLMDEELLSMKNFERYEPLDHLKSKIPKTSCKGFDFNTKHMILDGITLSNLDVTENSSTGTLDGTLLQRLDQCYTPFGKLHTVQLCVGSDISGFNLHCKNYIPNQKDSLLCTQIKSFWCTVLVSAFCLSVIFLSSPEISDVHKVQWSVCYTFSLDQVLSVSTNIDQFLTLTL